MNSYAELQNLKCLDGRLRRMMIPGLRWWPIPSAWPLCPRPRSVHGIDARRQKARQNPDRKFDRAQELLPAPFLARAQWLQDPKSRGALANDCARKCLRFI